MRRPATGEARVSTKKDKAALLVQYPGKLKGKLRDDFVIIVLPRRYKVTYSLLFWGFLIITIVPWAPKP